MAFNTPQLIFIIVSTALILAAILAVTVRNLVHAALWMVLSFLGVAVLFVLLGTGFFAVVQVVIYIGAISVMILFVIMLTSRDQQEKLPSHTKQFWQGALFTLVFLILLIMVIQAFSPQTVLLSSQANESMVVTLGQALVSPEQYGVVFELASIFLLVALIGAIYLAQERKPENGGNS